MADYLLEVLREHRSEQTTLGGPVFGHPTPGLALTRHAVRRRGHLPAVEDAGLAAGLRVHDLRHTAATLWLAAGESIYFVQHNSATPTFRRPSTSTGTRTRPPTGGRRRGRRNGGVERPMRGLRYHGRYYDRLR